MTCPVPARSRSAFGHEAQRTWAPVRQSVSVRSLATARNLAGPSSPSLSPHRVVVCPAAMGYGPRKVGGSADAEGRPMPKVIADITMSLDGFVTGEGAYDRRGLGDAPEFHTWAEQQDAIERGPLSRSTITTLGDHTATVSVEFADAAGRGRQMQTWVHLAGAWKIVCAHVSIRSDSTPSVPAGTPSAPGEAEE